MRVCSRSPCAVLLTAEGRAKIGDVGLARFMPNDYLSTAAAAGDRDCTKVHSGDESLALMNTMEVTQPQRIKAAKFVLASQH